MPTIVYWKVVEDTVDVPQNVQCFYNIDDIERCDYLCSQDNLVDIKRTKERSDNIVAYSDVRVHYLANDIEYRLADLDNFFDRLEGYNIITLEDGLSDSQKSTIISRSLGFNHEPYVVGLGLNRNRLGRPGANTRQAEETEHDFWRRQGTFEIYPANRNFFHLPQDRLRNFAVWADIHNRLMIKPNKIFPTEMSYGVGDIDAWGFRNFRKRQPWKRIVERNTIFNSWRFYPLYSASLWEKYWLAIIDENGSIRGKYFQTFDKAESKVKKYILNNFDVDELPDFRYHPLTIVSPNHENVVVKLCKSYEFS